MHANVAHVHTHTHIHSLLCSDTDLLLISCFSFTFACTNVTAQSTTAGSLLVGQTDVFFVADNAIKESAYIQVTVRQHTVSYYIVRLCCYSCRQFVKTY